jgi:hypothetical protein
MLCRVTIDRKAPPAQQNMRATPYGDHRQSLADQWIAKASPLVVIAVVPSRKANSSIRTI